MQFLFLLLLALTFWLEIKILFPRNAKQKMFEIILRELQALKVGWLTQSNKSCNGQTLINECSILDHPSNFESLILPYVLSASKRMNQSYTCLLYALKLAVYGTNLVHGHQVRTLFYPPTWFHKW